jgi:putative FmdB family regulatory protein
MPIYVYRCVDEEDHPILEVTRSINDQEGSYKCEECSSTMVRYYTPFGIQFKGSGFYKTDNG